MLLCFIKALWQFETRELSRGASLLANTLEKIFAMAWTKLMGLKSVTLAASVFLAEGLWMPNLATRIPVHSD